MTAERISEWSQALGGDGHIALYYTPGGGQRPWKAITTVDKPRVRGRYLEVLGTSPDDAMMRLQRTMPAVPNGLRATR